MLMETDMMDEYYKKKREKRMRERQKEAAQEGELICA